MDGAKLPEQVKVEEKEPSRGTPFMWCSGGRGYRYWMAQQGLMHVCLQKRFKPPRLRIVRHDLGSF